MPWSLFRGGIHDANSSSCCLYGCAPAPVTAAAWRGPRAAHSAARLDRAIDDKPVTAAPRRPDRRSIGRQLKVLLVVPTTMADIKENNNVAVAS